MVISQKYDVIEGFTIRNDFAVSYNETHRVGDLNVPQSIIDAGGEPFKYSFFPESSRVYLEEAIPKLKANLATTFNIKKLDIYLRNSYFGKVTDPGATDVNLDGSSSVYEHPEYSAKIVTDLSLGYQINEKFRVTLGVNNIRRRLSGQKQSFNPCIHQYNSNIVSCAEYRFNKRKSVCVFESCFTIRIKRKIWFCPFEL